MKLPVVQALSIHQKLILLVLLILVLPFSFFGYLWYDKSSEVIEENAITYSKEIVRNVSLRLDDYFTDINKLTLPLLNNETIQSFMRIHPKDEYEHFAVSTKIWTEIYPNVVYGRKDILGFSIVSRKGLFFSGTFFGRSERLQKYESLFREEGRTGILGIHFIDSIPVITVFRKLIDNTTFQTEGVIVMDLTLDEIYKITDNMELAGNGHIAIIDSKGHFIYHPDPSLWGQPIPSTYEAGFKVQESLYIDHSSTKGEKIIYQHSQQTKLTMVTELSVSELTGNLQTLRNITLWIAMILILLAVIVMILFSFSLTKSLGQLLRLMKSAELGDLHVKAPEHRRDEIGRLYRGFNKMVNELKRLIEVIHYAQLAEKEMMIRQREALLMAMQSRINPHFLYNTLEVINSYAIEKDVSEISRMTISLAGMFRYSVGSSDQMVTLKEEMDHVKRYLSIQKERYDGMIVNIQANDEELQRVKALRLVIQPIVENSFIHGYEKAGRKPGYLEIVGEALANEFVLTIIDNGKGMPEHLRKQYNDAFLNTDDSRMVMEREQPFECMGLWNVHTRIRMTFGYPYGLSINASSDRGTIIEIRLPRM